MTRLKIHLEIERAEYDGEDASRAFLGALSRLAAAWVAHGASVPGVAKALRLIARQPETAPL